MATNEVLRGPISGLVVENVKRLRAERRWSLSEMSAQMAQVGRPMLTSGLNRIEQGKRRIDVDDLVALALAFNVSPLTLLMPWRNSGVVALTASTTAEIMAAWDWLRGILPLELPDGDDEAQHAALEFQLGSVPLGARLNEVKPGTPAYAERRRRQAAGFTRLRKEGTVFHGEHPQAP